jgi:hypothetical protein
MSRIEAKGSRGSWFATLPDGTALPCVHRHWRKGMEYDDPFTVPGDPVWDEFIAAIDRERRVILTDDEVLAEATEQTPPDFRRSGYIAVFAVEDVRVEGRHLRFRFAKRLQELK